jgi:hypothetical protein
MSLEISLDQGSSQSLEALARFLRELEIAYPAAARNADVVSDEGIIYVGAEFNTDDENWDAGEEMAEVSVRIQEETGVLVALSPRTRVSPEERSP